MFPVSCLTLKSSAQTINFLEIAEIQHIRGQNITVQRLINQGEAQTAVPGMQLQQPREKIRVGNQPRSHLSFTLANGEKTSDRRHQILVQMGNQDTPTEYQISCQLSVGEALIGFKGDNGLCDRGLKISFILDENTTSNLANQPSENTFYYCSFVGNSSPNWGVSFSNNLRENPCIEAQEKCQANQNQTTCLIASYGEWNAQDPDLAASIVCANNFIITRSGNGETMAEDILPLLQEMGKAVNATNCVFQVYQAHEMVVFPTGHQDTLIHVYHTDDQKLAVDALVGDGVVISADRGNGLTIPQGYGYRQEKEGLVVLNCPQIYQQAGIQQFLEADNWSQSREISVDPVIRDRLQQYQVNFCRTTGRTIHLAPNRS